jgi:RNA polymerase II-associated factor 1
MSSKRSKTDLLVRQRFLNPLPPPAFPPKLLTIKTDPSRYTSYDFLVPLSMERMVPMIVDGEGGMHLDQNAVPGYWETKQGRSGKMVPDMELEAPEMDEEDLELLAEPSMNLPGATNTVNAGLMPANSGANLDLVGSGVHAANSPATALEKRKKDVAFVHKTVMKNAGDSGVSARQESLAAAQCVPILA